MALGIKSRQGDLRIEAVEKVPKEAKKMNDFVIAEGETTGHKHQVKPVQGTVNVYETPEAKFVEVEKGGMAELVHEEHGTIELPEGIHEIKIQRQYDYLKESVQRVRD